MIIYIAICKNISDFKLDVLENGDVKKYVKFTMSGTKTDGSVEKVINSITRDITNISGTSSFVNYVTSISDSNKK